LSHVKPELLFPKTSILKIFWGRMPSDLPKGVQVCTQNLPKVHIFNRSTIKRKMITYLILFGQLKKRKEEEMYLIVCKEYNW